MTCNEWLELQRSNGGPHGFECIGSERMQQVWNAAKIFTMKECVEICDIEMNAFSSNASDEYNEGRAQGANAVKWKIKGLMK